MNRLENPAAGPFRKMNGRVERWSSHRCGRHLKRLRIIRCWMRGGGGRGRQKRKIAREGLVIWGHFLAKLRIAAENMSHSVTARPVTNQTFLYSFSHMPLNNAILLGSSSVFLHRMTVSISPIQRGNLWPASPLPTPPAGVGEFLWGALALDLSAFRNCCSLSTLIL